MNFRKFAQEIYFLVLAASLYLIQSKFIHSFIHLFIFSFQAGSHALMNYFKSSSSGENVTTSCIFESNYYYFFWR